MNEINPIALTLGPLQIRWYGILMSLSFLIGYFILRFLFRENKIKADAEEYLIYLIIGILGGARLFEIAYEPYYYLSDPVKILYVWQGGLASHGGIIGGVLATYLFCRKYKLGFYTLADIAVIPIALGAMFVRIGNFINGEIVGRITSVPWAMRFEGYPGLRHPSQLYEASKNFILFILLWNIRKVDSMKKPGLMFWSFIGIYSLFRFFVEFFKEYQTLSPDYILTMGQWLSMPLMILSVLFIYKLSKKH